MSQGQTLAVDSFPRSTVVDSLRIGPLVYRGATTLSYSKRGNEESVDVKGDLTTVLTVSNNGSASAPVAPVRCLTEYAFLNPDFGSIPRITGFPSTAACLKTSENFLLTPGEHRSLSYSSHNWKHGQYGILGPLYFVAELQSGDTVARLRSGRSVVSSDVSSLEYHATSAIEGDAPSSLVTRVTIFNRGQVPVHLSYGDCSLNIRLFKTDARSGSPVWRSEFRGLPATMGKASRSGYACSLIGRNHDVAPSSSIGWSGFTQAIPTYEVLADSLPGGRYYATAELELNNKKMTFDAGSAVIPPKQKPLPFSRTLGGIQFSSSIQRVTFGGGNPDSLDLTFTARNTTAKAHRIDFNQSGTWDCIYMGGYKDPSVRDAYYLIPAYAADWTVRPCPLKAPPYVELLPGESQSIAHRIGAPEKPLHYIFVFDFWIDSTPGTAEQLEGDLAADEQRGTIAPHKLHT